MKFDVLPFLDVRLSINLWMIFNWNNLYKSWKNVTFMIQDYLYQYVHMVGNLYILEHKMDCTKWIGVFLFLANSNLCDMWLSKHELESNPRTFTSLRDQGKEHANSDQRCSLFKKKCKFFLNISFYLVSRHLNCVLKINFGEVALGRLLWNPDSSGWFPLFWFLVFSLTCQTIMVFDLFL